MNLKNLGKILKDEPSYRFKQAQRAVFLDLIEDWEQATTLSKDLRIKLNKECLLTINAQIQTSHDRQVVKALIELEDGNRIETVLMRHQDQRNTICVSTQVGCALGCKFCATGKLGFTRNLTSGEILLQVIYFNRYLKQFKQKISNVVFMGMGEPFLNYENVMEAIKILNSPDGFNIGARKISISTSGIITGIRKLAEENLQINLAISLHSADDRLRSILMPINKKYNLEKLFTAIHYYTQQTNRQVMFEYMLIKDVNDSLEHARQLANLMRQPLYLVNLIRYNPTAEFQPATGKQVKRFKEYLEKHGVKVTQRHEFGQDIKAACGQLALSTKNTLATSRVSGQAESTKNIKTLNHIKHKKN